MWSMMLLLTSVYPIAEWGRVPLRPVCQQVIHRDRQEMVPIHQTRAWSHNAVAITVPVICKRNVILVL